MKKPDKDSICNHCFIKDRVKNNCSEGNNISPTTLPSHALRCAIFQMFYEFNAPKPLEGFSVKAFEEFYHKELAPVLLKSQNLKHST